MSHSGSSAANPQGSDYEVFLSFRGSDTRKGFADFLYNSLVNAGIRAFRDNEELRVGEEIGDNLLEAISQSKISIPIFSKDYASSKWCLKEAAHMVKCRKTRNRNQLILPIFYDVTPDDVKNQSGTYEEALRLHSERYGEETAEEWRNALSEIGRLKGWELEKVADGHGGKLVSEVVSRVWRELQNAHLIIKDTIIGVEDKAEEVMKILDVGGSDVRIVGLYGIGGIGKTTLAKIIYNQLLEHFECSSFLKDVREISSQPRGLEKLQTQLVSDMTKSRILQCEFPHVDRGTKVLGERFKDRKVLILLDDVDKKDQIDALAADLNWFAGGSRILITTRYKHVLDAAQVIRKYEVKPMHHNEAFLLFCMHAFRRDSLIADYADLSRKIVATTGGLPLALEVIGSFLSAKRSRETWEDILEKLENAPHKDVQDKLKISYDALEPEHQQIFLDIACFFIGTDKRIAMYMWKDIGYYPAEGVEVLLAMSLIRIGDDYKFWMHDQLRDLGKEIVRKENIREPGERSRLWSSEDARLVLENHEGTRKVKAIQLDYGTESKGYCFTREQFMNLSNLEFLRLGGVNVSPDIWCPLRKLHWLQWHYCPIELMETSLYLENLVILDLSKSNVTEYWTGWSSRQLAIKLQVLILESCKNLWRMPDLSKFLSLKRLSFQECTFLYQLDPSIGKLKNLIFLSLKGCSMLKKLPQELGHLQALVELHIDESGVQRLPPLDGLEKLELLSAKGLPNCTEDCHWSLSEIPSSIGNLDSLLELLLDSSGVCTLPNSIGTLSKLKCLSLKDCKSLRELPETIGQLTSLEKLFLSRTKIHTLPNSIGGLINLQQLLVSRTEIMNLPNLGMLGKLEVLNALGCSSLRGEILIDVERQRSLTTLKLEGTSITMLPANINKLPHLKRLNLAHCNALQTLPQLPSSLEELWVTCRPMETFPDLSICKNLLELRLMECSKLKRIPGLGSLKNLKFLMVSRCQELTELNSLENLECMGELSISWCESLEKLIGLPKSKQFKTLKVDSCKSLKSLPNLSALKMLRHLSFANCERLCKVEGLGEIESLEYLNIRGCKSLQSLPNLSSLKMLRHLSFADCEKLCKVEGLGEIEPLEYLDMKGCKSLQSLPNLSSLKMLKHFNLMKCEKLRMVEGVEELELLEYVNLTNCKAIENLPNLSKLGKLKDLLLASCKKLKELRGLEELNSLKVDISYSPSLYHYVEEWPHLRWTDLPRSQVFSSKRIFLNFSDRDIMDYVDTYRGVSAFRDDREIGGELREAINQSKIAIPIFTKCYASSIRCLSELTHIMECKKKWNLSIFPIFYDVVPDHVQEQSESYEEAFKQHMNSYDANTIEGWRAALREVGALKGLEVQHLDDEHKEKLIKQHLQYVLQNRYLGPPDGNYIDIVGIKDHVEEVMRLLEIGANDVRLVGILGTSGVGKTTLATVIYNQLKERFGYCSFLADIRETSLQNRGIEELQGRLLSDMPRANNPKVLRNNVHVNKKVLIVVDNVDQIDQLSALVPYNGEFAPGSRIIITTRSKKVLDMYQVGRTYELKELQLSDALDLFHKHALGMYREPPPDLVALSSEIVLLCGGLPSTLELIGSILSGGDKSKWENVLQELRKVPCDDVQSKSKLRICYDALDDEVQETFLHVACFFIGMDCRVACNMPIGAASRIRDLWSMFLVHVDNNKLWMRDELRDLGREIVQQESYNVPGKGIRLCCSEKAMEVLNSKQDAKRIEALYLDCGYGSEDFCFKSEQFNFLHNLRFLRLNKGNIVGNFDSLLQNLRCLRWHQCPVELMATNLYLKELVILDLSESDILDDWNGWSFVQESFYLEVLILKSCRRLTKTPNLSAFPRLRMLILDDCKNLNYIDPSIERLLDLQFLSMKGCSGLEVLPQELSELWKLRELHIDETRVKEIPTLINVRVLSARKCECLLEIPDSVVGLRWLVELNLSHTGIRALPDSIENLTKLEVLDMSGSNIEYLPTTLGKLEKLEVINVSNCRNLKGKIVLQPMRLYSLTAFIMHGTNVTLPPSIRWLLHFPTLNLGIKRSGFDPVRGDPYWTEFGTKPPVDW